jgi:shikimate kinase
MSSKRIISLIGMPGSGKSTIGVLLAKRLGLEFVDTDILIQTHENATLAEIIARESQEYLREVEEHILVTMPIRPGMLLSTGGSVVYSDNIMARLTDLSDCIYLRARFETVEYRISLAPDRGIAAPKNYTFKDVYNERVPLYERYGEITVDVDDDAPEIIVGHIIEQLDESR